MAQAESKTTTLTTTPLDHRAILARAEQVVDLLRTRYVCEGWHEKGLDEPAAERMLQYFCRQADGDGAPEDDQDPEWEAALAFFFDHGQSLDWIMLGNPGGMITGAAACSARAEKIA
jgi:hypothetical protein